MMNKVGLALPCGWTVVVVVLKWNDCESTSHSVSESDLYTNYADDSLSDVSTDETMWNNFILQQKLFTKLLINYEPQKNFLNV